MASRPVTVFHVDCTLRLHCTGAYKARIGGMRRHLQLRAPDVRGDVRSWSVSAPESDSGVLYPIMEGNNIAHNR